MKNYLVIAALLMTSCTAEDKVPPTTGPISTEKQAEPEEAENKDENAEAVDIKEDGEDAEDEEEQEHDHHEGEDDGKELGYYFRYGVKNHPEDEKHEADGAANDFIYVGGAEERREGMLKLIGMMEPRFSRTC